MQATLDTQLSQMIQALHRPAEQSETANLLPIFVPASLFTRGDWPGPAARLRTPRLGLTWTVLQPDQTMQYVSFAMQRQWEEQGLDWKMQALRNLAGRTKGKPGLYEMRRASGDLYALAFMFQDGMGPSRLLFRGGLAERFPQGYRVALPEMSCGIAFARDLQGSDLGTVTAVIDHCYRKGNRPLVPGTYDPDDLLTLA